MKLIQKDGIDILFKNNKNTPRSAVCLYFSIDKPERYAGIYTLFSKLLLKGTIAMARRLLLRMTATSFVQVLLGIFPVIMQEHMDQKYWQQ